MATCGIHAVRLSSLVRASRPLLHQKAGTGSLLTPSCCSLHKPSSGVGAGLTAHHVDPDISTLLEGNRSFVADKLAGDPKYFSERASRSQRPRFLWIGCSDSRVPAETLCGVEPGDMFVSRNIANQIIATDMSMMSVLEYAVNFLKVEHIIVCGHYGCGGLKAALSPMDLSLIQRWLTPLRDIVRQHDAELFAIQDNDARLRRLVELNVQEQVLNILKCNFIQDARARSQHSNGKRAPRIHGMVYDLGSGHLLSLPVDKAGIVRRDGHIYQMDPNLVEDSK
eukprot:TRINITY_DN20916_c0_g1_i1.p1 TRINITY_DN20916_c0_g1~~TRINITY_DN20916_c0_g1_i1.p1  ORF type:complete len:281 (-),score=52.70 TRINITY_DN20916_c0_g1_i1:374-1216(-)